MGCGKSSSKREDYCNTILSQKTRKTSNRQPNFIPKTVVYWKNKNKKKKKPILVEGKK